MATKLTEKLRKRINQKVRRKKHKMAGRSPQKRLKPAIGTSPDPRPDHGEQVVRGIKGKGLVAAKAGTLKARELAQTSKKQTREAIASLKKRKKAKLRRKKK